MHCIDKIIVACDSKEGIGYQGKLPWPESKADMQEFIKDTEHSWLLMGSATWFSLPNKPLKNRHNCVLTTDEMKANAIFADGGYPFANMASFLQNQRITKPSETQIVCIGGSSLIKQCLAISRQLLLTVHIGDWRADTYMPANWRDYFRFVHGTPLADGLEKQLYYNRFMEVN